MDGADGTEDGRRRIRETRSMEEDDMFSRFITRTLCSLIVGTILVGYGTSFAQLAYWM